MAFCNKCGSSIEPGTRFCNKCGAPILASTLPTPSATSAPPASVPAFPPPAPARTGSNSLKVLLVAIGVIILLGILGIASAGFFAWHMAHRTRIHQNGNNVQVETPFGNVETTKDPAEAARNLGVDLYPGAEIRKDGAATATLGGMHSTSLSAETDDSVDQVSAFYKAKFPNAMVTTSNNGRCAIIANQHNSMITINIESRGDKTKIQITNMSRKSADNSSSN